MIRITDMTLSLIGDSRAPASQLRKLYSLLRAIGTDYIEMPADMYEKIGPEPNEQILLRIKEPHQAEKYPGISKFVCETEDIEKSALIMREIRLGAIPGKGRYRPHDDLPEVRLVGLDAVLSGDFGRTFKEIRISGAGRIDFCPENGYFCATAAAVEWIISGGTDVSAAFGGIGRKAALEEILVFLRMNQNHKPDVSLALFPHIAELLEDITGVRFSDRKAVIGRKIFNVESGVHVDGILKTPQSYEPFCPELVGRERRFIVGKHSGRGSITAKLHELGLSPELFDIAGILTAVRSESIKRLSGLTDPEFREIAMHHMI